MKNTIKLIGTQSLRLCVIALLAVIGFSFAACGNGTTNTGAETDEPLVYKAVVNGKTVEITVSRTDPSRTVLTPKEGDFYVIKYNGVVISKGRVTKVENSGRVTFTPAADSPGPKTEFVGTFATGSLTIPTIPMDGDDLTDVDATPDGGTSTGGTNTGGTGGGGRGGGGGGGGGGEGGGNDDPAPPAPTKVGAVTIADIPAEYNGKYAGFMAKAGTNEINGFESAANGVWTMVTLPQVNAGTVVIPAWVFGTWFTGNESAGSVEVFLLNDATVNVESSSGLTPSARFQNMTFSANSATLSWNDRILPASGTYTEDGVSISLEYADKTETTYSGGAFTYKTTHYLLPPGTFDAAKAALSASAAYDRPDSENDSFCFMGTFLSDAADFLIFEVNDFSAGNWGKDYRLLEYVGGVMNRSAIWQSAELEDKLFGPGGTEPTLNYDHLNDGMKTMYLGGDESKTLTEPLLSSEMWLYPSKVVEGRYTLPASYTFAGTKSMLEGIFGPSTEPEVEFIDPNNEISGSAGVYFYGNDLTNTDVTFPYRGIKRYARLTELDTGGNILNQAEWIDYWPK